MVVPQPEGLETVDVTVKVQVHAQDEQVSASVGKHLESGQDHVKVGGEHREGNNLDNEGHGTKAAL